MVCVEFGGYLECFFEVVWLGLVCFFGWVCVGFECF